MPMFRQAALVILTILIFSNWGGEPSRILGATPAGVETLSLAEAEILIYLLPQAQNLRSQGMDVGWELQTNPIWKLNDFYAFEVFNIKRKNADTSDIGFFSVNKHTGDIWDDVPLPKLVRTDSLEVGGVQRILREAHHIDSGTMTQYHNLRPQ